MILQEGNKELGKLINHYHNVVINNKHKFQTNKKLVKILLELNDQISDWIYYYDHKDKEMDKNSELELIDTILDMINILESAQDPK